jgi:hypothetical protein
MQIPSAGYQTPSSSGPAMFRITRGMHVQHIHFPLPVIRAPLDPDDIDVSAGREAPVAEDAAPPAVAEQATPERADG